MPNLTEKEVTFIQDTVASHQLAARKLGDYANECTDSNFKNMFSKASTEASQSAQKLIDML